MNSWLKHSNCREGKKWERHHLREAKASTAISSCPSTGNTKKNYFHQR
jgi:hypothetical protein